MWHGLSLRARAILQCPRAGFASRESRARTVFIDWMLLCFHYFRRCWTRWSRLPVAIQQVSFIVLGGAGITFGASVWATEISRLQRQTETCRTATDDRDTGIRTLSLNYALLLFKFCLYDQTKTEAITNNHIKLNNAIIKPINTRSKKTSGTWCHARDKPRLISFEIVPDWLK